MDVRAVDKHSAEAGVLRYERGELWWFWEWF
jgi:hypothetical protein